MYCIETGGIRESSKLPKLSLGQRRAGQLSAAHLVTGNRRGCVAPPHPRLSQYALQKRLSHLIESDDVTSLAELARTVLPPDVARAAAARRPSGRASN